MLSERSRAFPHRLPSLFHVVVCAVSLVLVLKTVPDVDLWGHVTFGRDMLESGSIPTHAAYSFTSDRPWINHEWLAEVTLGSVYGAFGAAGLIALRWSLLVLLSVVVWWHLRRQGTPADRTVFLLALIGLLTYPRTQHLRPQLLSVLAFAVLLASLKEAERGRRVLLYALPALMVVWANAHGGWIVGFGTLAAWAAAKSLSRESRRIGVLGCGVAVISLAATLLNPYGIHMWEFLRATVGPLREDIVEWHPVMRAGFGVFAMWAATALLVARAMWRRRIGEASDAILLVTLGLASMRVSRLDAFFALAAVMLCRDGLISGGFRGPVGAIGSGRPVPSLFAAAVFLPFGLGVLAWASGQVACISLRDAEWLPEPEAVAFARASGLHGNLLTYFDWGEYAIWHLSPAVSVSIDGRRETIYSNEQIAGHLAVYANRPEGLHYLERIAPDHVWLPKDMPVLRTLVERGWAVRFSGSRSVLLSRAGAGTAPVIASTLASTSQSGRRCFPGP